MLVDISHIYHTYHIYLYIYISHIISHTYIYNITLDIHRVYVKTAGQSALCHEMARACGFIGRYVRGTSCTRPLKMGERTRDSPLKEGVYSGFTFI